MRTIVFILFFSFIPLNAWTESAEAYSYKVGGTDYCLYNITWWKGTFTYYYNGAKYRRAKGSQLDSLNAVDSFYYNGSCHSEEESVVVEVEETPPYEDLNMTIEDYNLMMALSANFLGFTLVFLVGFLFILQGRR